MLAIGRSRTWYRRIAARAGASGGSTSAIRSSRPGRRSAPSTSHGALVAARTKTPSLLPSMPSSSASNWLPRVRRTDECSWLRLCPSASISSRNSTHGALRRAASKISCRFFSELPTHMLRTSTMDSARNLACISPATARARNVLPQPGGPYSSRPPRRLLPYIARSCGLRSGPRNASSSRCFTSVMPPTSASRTVETSTSNARSAAPRTGSATSSARVNRGGMTSDSCSS